MDLHDHAARAAHEALDDFWASRTPADYEAAQVALTTAMTELGRARAALARTRRSTR